ncbi:Transcriptional repressor smtB homolog [Proteiniborus sp. DW1]|uniref:ArsR/SmtB family transcription factor n=1 Tax=Proteiniborus sp. DW1 TaxID=1889883 RepID=UPI00092DF339|nr:metalloregulator ArsR/SmtB family transcription factor [Proteiniborus sp. DW1]SCG81753.1 Transcriptional repressor smtB homolog [Proteiniborus sp. DW1]
MVDLEQDSLCDTNEVNKETVNKIKKDILPDSTIEGLSEIFKALGDPTRLKIINVLSKQALCVYDIADILSMSQSAISHQLRVLRGLRLVKYRKEGKHVIYSLDDDHVLQLFNQGIDHISHE